MYVRLGKCALTGERSASAVMMWRAYEDKSGLKHVALEVCRSDEKGAELGVYEVVFITCELVFADLLVLG